MKFLAPLLIMFASLIPQDISSLWAQYDKADKTDKPKDKIEILEKIKEQSFKKRLHWDFYLAASRRVEVGAEINWKDRARLQEKLEQDVKKYDEPIVSFYHNQDIDARKAIAAQYRNQLQQGKNTDFYSKSSQLALRNYQVQLDNYISDDYEYTLWMLDDFASLKEYTKGRYPQTAFVDYFKGTYSDFDKNLIEGIKQQYPGKAMALVAEFALIENEFGVLREEKAGSNQFKALYQRCIDLRKEIKAYSGDDKLILKNFSAEAVINSLEEKALSAEIKEGTISIHFRNLPEAEVEIISGSKSIFSRKVNNHSQSFYAIDTVCVELPEIADGRYSVVLNSGKISEKSKYHKYSLSIAHRTDAQGHEIYVADYMSGEPVRQYSLLLKNNNGDILAREEVSSDGGFYRISPSFYRIIKENRWSCYLSAQYVDKKGQNRSSDDIIINISETRARTPQLEAKILCDKGAYTPEETLYYKAILYYDDPDGKSQIIGKDEHVEVSLHDPEDNVIAKEQLSCNSFGSVNGSFRLAKGLKGGRYRINVSHNGKHISSRVVQIDEFILPSFELIWEEPDQLYFGGDSAVIKGHLKSYSGHSLVGAKLQLNISLGTDVIVKEELIVGEGSSFEKTITLPEVKYYGSCQVEAIVTDLSGETLVFNNSLQILGRIDINCQIENEDSGRAQIKDSHSQVPIVSSDVLKLWTYCTSGFGDLSHPSLSLSYKIVSDSNTVSQGALKDNITSIDIHSLSPGLYKIVIDATVRAASGKEYKDTHSCEFLRIKPEQDLPKLPLQCFFREPSDKVLELQMGSGGDPIWAVATLYGNGNTLLDSQLIQIEKGDRTLRTISFEQKSHYPEDLNIVVFYFKDGDAIKYRKDVHIPKASKHIPLSFIRFQDRTAPRSNYRFILQTQANVECTVSIFDASSETIRSNRWSEIYLSTGNFEYSYYSSQCGSNNCRVGFLSGQDMGAMGYSARVLMSKANTSVESGVLADSIEEVSQEATPRSDFSTTLLWAPDLRANLQGQIDFNLRTLDKTGRFIVNVLAHNQQLNSSALRQEITVSMPVEVSIAQPQYLFVGDRYVARMSASNSTESSVSGQVEMIICDPSGNAIAQSREAVTIPAGGRIEHICELSVPHIEGTAFADQRTGAAQQLSVTASFIASDTNACSDAVKVNIPVYIRAQALRESHSALLLVGADKNALVAELRERFVNLPAEDATIREISIRQMLQDAIPQKLSAESDNALSLSNVLYAEQLLWRIPGARRDALSAEHKAEVLEKLLACRDNNGGWAWFEGMNASPYITAALLEQWADMQLPAELAELVPDAVQYLDKMQFGAQEKVRWQTRLSLAEYLHVRAQYADVPLQTKGISKKALSEFKKDARKYLGLKGDKVIQGNIFEKVRKMQTIIALHRSGIAMSRALDKELASLLQYAVSHPSGGSYYPNAVMPFRGLLDSELYAHTQICALLDALGEKSVAEQIRLWIMTQKETQQWESDPAYLAALAQVLKGSEATLESKVLVMSTEGELPFDQIKPSGNGFKLEVEYHRDGKVLKEGDVLKLGDKITAIYKIWSEENRSFVRLTAPRPASFRPVDQLSGNYHFGGARPFGPGSTGYREVRAERSIYYFDVFPEEHSTISEEFVVTQDGSFGSAALEVQCLYADHYRSIAPWAL